MLKLRVLACGVVASFALVGCGTGEAPYQWNEYALAGTYSASISESGRFAAIGSFNHGGSLWLVSRHARQFDWNHAAGDLSLIKAVGFSPDDNYAMTADQQTMVLWKTDTGAPEGFWSAPAEILELDLSPQGDFALLGLANHTAVYFDAKNGGERQVFRHQGRVESVDLSNDASLALTGSSDYKATLWNVETAEKLHTLEFDNIVDTVAISPNNNLAFTSASLDKAVIWDTKTGKVKHTLSDIESLFAKRMSYLSADFSKDGSKLLTGSASGLVQLWDVRSGKLLKSWRMHKRDAYGPVDTGVYAVSFSRTGAYYALGSNGIMNTLR
ncbi:MAG: WD40 repeat domain-containing protein [Pontibacterium sp.]